MGLDDVVRTPTPAAILAAVGEPRVMTFTHHPRVVAPARQVVPAEVLTVHELGGNEISGARRPQIAPADARPLRPAKTP